MSIIRFGDEIALRDFEISGAFQIRRQMFDQKLPFNLAIIFLIHSFEGCCQLISVKTVLLAIVATDIVPRPLIVPMFVVTGFVLGATGPSRDLIVRNATPKGAAGRVYGFVYSGLDLGATLGPVWFGLMLDHGLAREMFFVIAALLLVAIGTVVNVRRAVGVRAA